MPTYNVYVCSRCGADERVDKLTLPVGWAVVTSGRLGGENYNKAVYELCPDCRAAHATWIKTNG